MVNRCSECGRNNNCTLVPFLKSDPCYQGPQTEIQSLKTTNPLVKNTTIECDNCKEYNFNYYYRNDVIYPDIQLFTSYLKYCSQCSLSSNCLIVPFTLNKTTDICSQGNHSQIQLKYNLESNINEKYLACGYCKEFGFSEYYKQDLIFSEVTEWIPPSNNNNGNGNDDSSKHISLPIIILFLTISGIIILIILISIFRKSIWKNELKLKRNGYNQLTDNDNDDNDDNNNNQGGNENNNSDYINLNNCDNVNNHNNNF